MNKLDNKISFLERYIGTSSYLGDDAIYKNVDLPDGDAISVWFYKNQFEQYISRVELHENWNDNATKSYSHAYQLSILFSEKNGQISMDTVIHGEAAFSKNQENRIITLDNSNYEGIYHMFGEVSKSVINLPDSRHNARHVTKVLQLVSSANEKKEIFHPETHGKNLGEVINSRQKIALGF